jgi:hypothetical protein
MGKATMLSDKMRARRLSPTEVTTRQAAIEIGDPNVRATADGKFVKQEHQSEAPRVLAQAEELPWD